MSGDNIQLPPRPQSVTRSLDRSSGSTPTENPIKWVSRSPVRMNESSKWPSISCQSYIQHGNAAKDIVILAGYLVQIGLPKRALALTPGLEDMDASTTDAY